MSQKQNPPAPIPLTLAPKPINVFRWRSVKMSDTPMSIGGHTVQIDASGWLPSELPRAVENYLEGMTDATRQKLGFERKVLNEDDAWIEDIERADNDIKRAEQEVERAKQRMVESQIALSRAKQRKVELDNQRQEYKDQVSAIIADAEAAAAPAKPNEKKTAALG